MTHLVWIIPLVGFVLGIIGFFIVRYMKQQDEQNEKLFLVVDEIKNMISDFKTKLEVHQVRTEEKLEQHEQDINRMNKNVGLLFRKHENLEKKVLRIEENPKLKKHG